LGARGQEKTSSQLELQIWLIFCLWEIAEDVAASFAEGVSEFPVEGGERSIGVECELQVGGVVCGEVMEAPQLQDFTS
jgi:hypothetical protein